jgi:hypothetical protein
MATAKEYFERNIHLEVAAEWTAADAKGQTIPITIKMVFDFEGGSKHLKVFVPETDNPDHVVAALADKKAELLAIPSGTQVFMGQAGTQESIGIEELNFSGRLLVYTPSVVDRQRWVDLREALAKKGLHLVVRDGSYIQALNEVEKPKAFISHDSRDKEPFVRELASKLASMMCPVWYDEYSLVAGQSLRASIEDGLKKCPKCVVVLSKNFFANPGWSKREFDMIYTREILEGKRVMIPIWHGVTKQEVFEYSPILLDTLGIPSDIGADAVAGKIVAAINHESKT